MLDVCNLCCNCNSLCSFKQRPSTYAVDGMRNTTTICGLKKLKTGSQALAGRLLGQKPTMALRLMMYFLRNRWYSYLRFRRHIGVI